MANPKRARTEHSGDQSAASAAANPLDDMENAEAAHENDRSETDSDGGESECEETESSDADDMLDSVVNVDFDAFPPDDSDFHGIKKLLLQLFRSGSVNVSDLSKHLIQLNKVSVILRQAEDDEKMGDDDDEEDEDDNEVFGVSGILPMGGEREGIKSVRHLLLQQASGKNASLRPKLDKLFEDANQVGLLISERFINIPPRAALPLLESIHNDFTKMKESSGGPFSKVETLVLICKQYIGSAVEIFANGEEELFVDLADFQFDYEIPQEDADTAVSGRWRRTDQELKQVRKVIVLNINKLPQMIKLVKENV